jgi:hypothetical protein
MTGAPDGSIIDVMPLMTFTPDRRPIRPGLSRRQPMRASAAVAVAALLSFGVVACSDDRSMPSRSGGVHIGPPGVVDALRHR